MSRAAGALLLLVCLLVCLLAAGCSSGADGRMAGGSAPDGWEASVSEWRARRDAMMRDAETSPLLPADLPGFAGLQYFDVDPSYRFEGPIQFYPRPERFQIITTAGKQRPCDKIGWLTFRLGGEVHILQVYRLVDIGEPFLPFTDGTSGEESYPAGRYIDIEMIEEGRYVLDFNRAYNPSCAYGDPQRFACPVTPKENRMIVRVEAGEKGFKEEGS